ncbi:MAG: hypothetical protein ABWY82_26415, partial [Tardiphaga sp.]
KSHAAREYMATNWDLANHMYVGPTIALLNETQAYHFYHILDVDFGPFRNSLRTSRKLRLIQTSGATCARLCDRSN